MAVRVGRISSATHRLAVPVLGGLLAVAGVVTGGAPASAGSGSAKVVETDLSSVFCTSAANCWAVGHGTTALGNLNLVLHWTGSKWFTVAVPSPAGTGKGDDSQLAAVRCVSAASCWAVGDYSGSNTADFDQALHWNGQHWSLVKTPSPGGRSAGDFSGLDDVACTSGRSCWAVGDYGRDVATGKTEFEVILNQVLHWNGKAWASVSVPNPARTGKNDASNLTSVRCASAVNCWAAGSFGNLGKKKFVLRNQLLHWNGKKWAVTTVPSPAGTATGDFSEIQGLSCTAATNCWAAGFYGSLNAAPAKPSLLNQVLRWNGKKWLRSAVPSPGPSSAGKADELGSITCNSASDCWAVGQAGNIDGTKVTLNTALHWNGTKWSVVGTPNPGGNGMQDRSGLNSVRCTSSGNCWAVGAQEPKDQPRAHQILHWNGKKWSAS
jgi:hypothetical protein